MTIGIILTKNIPNLNTIYEKQKELLSIKLESLVTGNSSDLSMKIRDEKYDTAKQNMDNVIKRTFGLGLLGYNANEVKVGSLENMYRTMYVCYGIIGIIAFVGFIIENICKSILKIKGLNRIFLVTLFLVFTMHAYTLEVLYIPTISYSMAIFYCYIINKSENKSQEIM